jgi:hypothetical protein
MYYYITPEGDSQGRMMSFTYIQETQRELRRDFQNEFRFTPDAE